MDLILFSIVIFINLTFVIHIYWYFKDLEHFYPELYSKINSPFGAKKRSNPFVGISFWVGGKYNHLLDKRFAQGRKYIIIHFAVVVITLISLAILFFILEASPQTVP